MMRAEVTLPIGMCGMVKRDSPHMLVRNWKAVFTSGARKMTCPSATRINVASIFMRSVSFGNENL